MKNALLCASGTRSLLKYFHVLPCNASVVAAHGSWKNRHCPGVANARSSWSDFCLISRSASRNSRSTYFCPNSNVKRDALLSAASPSQDEHLWNALSTTGQSPLSNRRPSHHLNVVKATVMSVNDWHCRLAGVTDVRSQKSCLSYISDSPHYKSFTVNYIKNNVQPVSIF